jgi:hypothetical protein
MGCFRVARAETADTIKVRLQAESSVIQGIPENQRSGMEISEDTSPQARRLAESAAAGKPPAERAFPVLLIAVGVLSIPALYSAILEMWRQTIYHGVLIDARTAPVSIFHDPAIPPEMVIVIDTAGDSTKYSSRQFNLELLTCILAKTCKG